MIYADWNATTPPHPDVQAAMLSASRDGWGNPASVHGVGRSARAHVERARERVAALAGFDARDVVFTSGGTEANNLALRSIYGAAAGPRALVTSAIEHPSVLRTAEALAKEGAEVIFVAPEPSGVVLVESVVRALDTARAPVALVSLSAVNHETGVIQPVAELAAICAARGVLLHSDIVQALGRLRRETWQGADLVTVAAHKIRGPKGVGAVVTSPCVRLRASTFGGAQERGVRPGTQDGVACAGFARAAELALDSPSAYERMAERRDRLESVLVSRHGAQVNGTGARAPHVTNLSFAGWNGPELVAALDLEGVSVSSGAACSAGTTDPSPVIAAMLGNARAVSAVRISLWPSLGDGDDPLLDELVAAFGRVCQRTPSRVL